MSTLCIRGGHVLTPNMTIDRFDVVVDQGTGRIRELVEPGSVEADRTLDATNGLVIPGLVNAHTHVAMTLLRGYADDKPVQDWLEEDIWPVEAHLEPADVAAGARLGLLEMIQSGTTAFADMYFHVDEIAAAVADAGIRALLGYGIITVGKDEAAIAEELETGKQVVTDFEGAADGRISTALMPHAIGTVAPDTLSELSHLAERLDVPIHFHASESLDDVDAVCTRDGQRPIATADEAGLLDASSFLAHGVHLDSAEIDVLARTGTGVAHCPTANMKLASGLAPVVDLLDAGVPVGIGTDGPASNNDLDMIEELRQAALVGKIAADAASATDAATVVHMATEGSAQLLGLDTGVIEPNAPADLAVIDLERPHFTPAHDLVSHLVYAANGADVRHTICDGTVLMRDRNVVVFDEDEVRATASERASDLLARAS